MWWTKANDRLLQVFLRLPTLLSLAQVRILISLKDIDKLAKSTNETFYTHKDNSVNVLSKNEVEKNTRQMKQSHF